MCGLRETGERRMSILLPVDVDRTGVAVTGAAGAGLADAVVFFTNRRFSAVER